MGATWFNLCRSFENSAGATLNVSLKSVHSSNTDDKWPGVGIDVVDGPYVVFPNHARKIAALILEYADRADLEGRVVRT